MVKVLVVDDEAPIREALRDLMEDEGYDVEEVRDGREALAALERDDVSYVVLLDLIMPHLGGTDVLRVVAQRPDWKRRHAFILLTARHDARCGELAALMGDIGVRAVEKPFDIQELCEAVLQAHVGLAAGHTTGVHPGCGALSD